MPKILLKNNEQDVKIARIDEKLGALENKFNDFVNNEFSHLRGSVDKIIWGGIIGWLTTIGAILLAKVL